MVDWREFKKVSLVVAERKVSSWNDLTLVLVSLTVQVRFFTLVVSLVAGSSFKVSRMVKIDLTLAQPQEPGVDIFLGVGLVLKNVEEDLVVEVWVGCFVGWFWWCLMLNGVFEFCLLCVRRR